MKTLLLIAGVVVVLGAVALFFLERRPGYGVYYGIAKLAGSPLDIGPVDFATLRRHVTPNDALVCPANLCRNAAPDSVALTYALSPADLLAWVKAVALAEPNVDALDAASDRTARFVQRTRLIRYPDTIDIEVFPAEGGRSTLAIYSRSLVGSSDFGVNAARVKRWLAALSAHVG